MCSRLWLRTHRSVCICGWVLLSASTGWCWWVLLVYAAQRVSVCLCAAQVTKLAQELAEYKAESRELKNQDLTIRKLQEKVASLEADLTEKVGAALALDRAPSSAPAVGGLLV